MARKSVLREELPDGAMARRAVWEPHDGVMGWDRTARSGGERLLLAMHDRGTNRESLITSIKVVRAFIARATPHARVVHIHAHED